MNFRHVRNALCALLTAAAFLPAVAYAQDSIVMRKVIDTGGPNMADPHTMRPVEGADLSTYHWEVSGWFNSYGACSATASETRLLGCVKNGRKVEESFCPAPAPATERPVIDYSGCKFSWITTGSGEWASGCSSSTTRPVSSQCRRDDGTIVKDASCDQASRPKSETGPNYASCNYAWSVGDYAPWKSACSTSTERTRPVSCLRSNGEAASDSNCAGTRPESVERGQNLAGCGYTWIEGAWDAPDSTCSDTATQTRTNTCMRSDQTPVDPSLCTSAQPSTSQTVESVSGCSFHWTQDSYGDWSSTCSKNATRTRTVSCSRSDLKPAEDGRCPGTKPETMEMADISTSCSFSWKTSDWSQVPSCSATSQRTRSVYCQRSDGSAATEAQCVASEKPTTSEPVADYSNCSFSWQTGGYGAWDSTCSDSTSHTREVFCQRSDLTRADGQCDETRKPGTSETQAVYTGCAVRWTYGEWSAYGSTCSAASTRTRSATCVQSKPTGDVVVADTFCSGEPKETTSDSMAIYSSCAKTWVTGTWGWNGTANATSSTCDTQAQQTMTPTCQATLTTGAKVTVEDSNCSAASKPATTRITPTVTSCTYRYDIGAWSPYSSTCSSAATHTRTVACKQSDPLNTTVADSTCYAKGLGYAVARTETVSNVTDCTGLLQNGGFETGTADPWVLVGSTASISTIRPHSGTKSLHLSTSSTYAAQTISTVPGKRYSASMWVSGFSGQTANMQVNGASVIGGVNSGSNTNMAQGGGYFTATGTSTTIIIYGQSNWSFGDIYVDDVVVSPEP